jgi:hypothetical protein
MRTSEKVMKGCQRSYLPVILPCSLIHPPIKGADDNMSKATVKEEFERQGINYNREAVNYETQKCPKCKKGVLRGANLKGYDPDKYVACCECKTGFRAYISK